MSGRWIVVLSDFIENVFIWEKNTKNVFKKMHLNCLKIDIIQRQGTAVMTRRNQIVHSINTFISKYIKYYNIITCYQENRKTAKVTKFVIFWISSRTAIRMTCRKRTREVRSYSMSKSNLDDVQFISKLVSYREQRWRGSTQFRNSSISFKLNIRIQICCGHH